MPKPDSSAQTADLGQLLAERLGAKGGSLDVQLRRARSRLPRRLRREADFLAAAAPLLDHPRLARQVDPARVEAAEAALAGHLHKIDRKAQRRGAILDTIAAVAFAVLVIAGLALWLAWRQGRI